MKKTMIFVILLLLVTFTASGCSSNNVVKPDSPIHTTMLMKLSIDNQDYDSFNALFSEGRKGTISKSDFDKLKELTTSGTEHTTYQLLTFDNGEMLLVRLTPPNEDHKVEIQDVIVVPENMRELFQIK